MEFGDAIVMQYAIIFICSAVLSYVFSRLAINYALKAGIVDSPNALRKKHLNKTPLLGGIGIFLAFFLTLFFLRDSILVHDLALSNWIGVFVGSLILIVGGYFDDKHNLRPNVQIIFPIFASISVIIGGVEVSKITNPISSELVSLSVFVSGFFIFLWLMGTMYTTKLLDGLDGLVVGVIGIGATIISLFTYTTKYYQPDVGLAGLVLSGACFGFLILNWNPAKIFLGEGGSLFLGFIIGVLAIISGGKVAIALLVMGIPIIDTAWTIIRRLIKKKNPFSFADRLHLHFLLNDSGLGTKKTVILYYIITSVFGVSALFLQTKGKLMALVLLLLIMIACVIFIGSKKGINNTD